MENCIFCKIARGEIPCNKIYENDEFFSVLDINPAVKGHSLVISKKHFKTSLELPNTLGPDLLDCIKGTSIKLKEKYGAEGFNIVTNIGKVANQAVYHVHFHILPRKKGDKNPVPKTF